MHLYIYSYKYLTSTVLILQVFVKKYCTFDKFKKVKGQSDNECNRNASFLLK